MHTPQYFLSLTCMGRLHKKQQSCWPVPCKDFILETWPPRESGAEERWEGVTDTRPSSLKEFVSSLLMRVVLAVSTETAEGISSTPASWLRLSPECLRFPQQPIR